MRLTQIQRLAAGFEQFEARLSALGQLEFIQVVGMRAAPILEIAGAFERQLVLQIALDELVVFDELAIEARRRALRISLGNRASPHGQTLLWTPIMTCPARGICDMIGQ